MRHYFFLHRWTVPITTLILVVLTKSSYARIRPTRTTVEYCICFRISGEFSNFSEEDPQSLHDKYKLFGIACKKLRPL